jgi:glycosyl transferase family 25
MPASRASMKHSLEIIVISLPTAHDRRAVIKDIMCQQSEFPWRFYEALTAGDHVEGLANRPDRQLAQFGRILTPAEIGCFKSHFTVLSSFTEIDTAEWLLVLEDDVWLDTNFDISEVLDFAKANNISYVRLFAKKYQPAKLVGSLSNFRQIIRFKTDPYGAQAYLINKTGARRFISGIATIDIPFDDELGRFWRHGLYPFSVFPFPVVERSVRSSIEYSRNQGNETRRKYRLDLLTHRILEKTRKTGANAVQFFRERYQAWSR